MSRVDVIVPCYNYGRFLGQCVESVLSQQVDVRVLIIDDASVDKTADVGSQLAADDHRVEFHRHQTNRGHIATYNEGLEWVSGDYTLLLSADDLLTPGALGRAISLLDRNANVGFVYGSVISFYSDDETPLPPARPGLDSWTIASGQDWLQSICAEGDNLITSPEVVVRTELLRKLGGYRADLPHTADMELWMRIAAHSSVAIIEADQAYYRLHGTNMSEQYNSRHMKQYRRPTRADYIQRKAAYDALFQSEGDHLTARDNLEQLAIQGLAWNAFWNAHNAFERGDNDNCNELLNVATSLLPELAGRREWTRLEWKRRIGPKAWTVAKTLMRSIRRTSPRPSWVAQNATFTA